MSLLPNAQCQFKTYRHEHEILLSLIGTVQLPNSEELKTAILPYLEGNYGTIYVLLNQVEMLDSAGLGVLVGVHMTARSRKAILKYVLPTAFVLRLFETTRLTSVLTILSGIEGETVRQRLVQPEYLSD